MKLVVEPEAVQDVKRLSMRQQKYVHSRLAELEDDPTGHEDSGLIYVRDHQLFKFTMKDGDDSQLDFRAVYDIEGSDIRVYAVFHRDEGYNKDMINERIESHE